MGNKFRADFVQEIMILTEEERQRIRAEEWVRLEARQDFRRTSLPLTTSERLVAVFVPLFVVAAVFLTVTTR